MPDSPGLGVELNEAVVKEHLRYPGYFEPTPMYDEFIVSGFRAGGPWPHYRRRRKLRQFDSRLEVNSPKGIPMHRDAPRLVARTTAVALLFVAVWPLAAAEKPIDPTFLRRHVPDLKEQAVDVTTPSCHYRPIFGLGDAESRIARGVARFGEMTIDPQGRMPKPPAPARSRSMWSARDPPNWSWR